MRGNWTGLLGALLTLDSDPWLGNQSREIIRVSTRNLILILPTNLGWRRTDRAYNLATPPCFIFFVRLSLFLLRGAACLCMLAYVSVCVHALV